MAKELKAFRRRDTQNGLPAGLGRNPSKGYPPGFAEFLWNVIYPYKKYVFKCKEILPIPWDPMATKTIGIQVCPKDYF